ncbi:hypothetical protein ACVNPS_05935 [Candidatus Bipolaricaulota sp. J31]
MLYGIAKVFDRLLKALDGLPDYSEPTSNFWSVLQASPDPIEQADASSRGIGTGFEMADKSEKMLNKIKARIDFETSSCPLVLHGRRDATLAPQWITIVVGIVDGSPAGEADPGFVTQTALRFLRIQVFR